MEESTRLVLLHGLAVVLQHGVLVLGLGEPDTCIVDQDVAVELLQNVVGVLGLAVGMRTTLRLLLTGPVVDGLSKEHWATRNLSNDPLELLGRRAVRQLTNEDACHALLGRRGVVDAHVLHRHRVGDEVQMTLQILVESTGDHHVALRGGTR